MSHVHVIGVWSLTVELETDVLTRGETFTVASSMVSVSLIITALWCLDKHLDTAPEQSLSWTIYGSVLTECVHYYYSAITNTLLLQILTLLTKNCVTTPL